MELKNTFESIFYAFLPTIIGVILVRDIRFTTSKFLDGSDAMNPNPDYKTYLKLP